MRLAPTGQILDTCQKSWGLSAQPKLIRKVENFVYESKIEEKKVFLRIAETHKRNDKEVESELLWLEFLLKNGISTCMFIPTISGAPFIKVSDAKLDFIATLFLGVSGKQAKDPSDFTPEMFKKWGHYIGQLQEKSRLFQSTVKDFNRKSWSQDSLYLMVEDEIQTEVGYIFEVFTELKKKLLYLEKDPLSYGLIHADLHHGNFFLDQNTNLTAIDFDDACISWYAYDLAVAEFSLDHFFFDQNIHLGFDYKPIFYGGFLSAKNDSSRSVLKSVPLFLLYRSIMMNLWCKKRIREEKDCAAIRRWCSSCRDWTQTKILETSKKIMV